MMVWIISNSLLWSPINQQAVSVRPDNVAVNELLTRFQTTEDLLPLPSSQTAEAVTVSENMKKLADSYAIAQTEIGNGRYDAALVQINTCLALDDASNKALSVDLWLKKGALHSMLGDNWQALAGMDKALEIAPDTAEAWLAKSQILSDSNQLTDAITSLLEYIRLKPSETQVYANLAQLQYNAGQYYSAIQNCTTYLERSNGVDAAVYFLRGSSQLQLSLFQSACEDFLVALNNGYDAAECYAQAAYCQLILQNYTAAVAYCSSCLEQGDPQNAAILVLRGSCLIQLEEFEAAAIDFQAAFHLNYQQAECAEQAAYCHLMLKDYTAALQAGEQALQLGRVQDTLYQQLGVAALGLQQAEKAADYFTKSIELNPDFTMNHYYRGVCWMMMKDYESADSDFSLSLEKREMTQVSFYNRGICRIYLEKYDDARKDMEQAISSGPDETIAKSATEIIEQLKWM